ncbi:MAG TPA: CSLREA domain-containing protein, partial [Pyrinomonadaceae bacterium]
MNNKFLNKINLFLLLSAFILAGAAQSILAVPRTVTKLADTDDGVCNADCSLREAVDVAINGDNVTFVAGLAGQTISLTKGAITIADKNILIIGLDGLSVSGINQSRIFHITDGAIVNINNLDMKEGFAQDPDVLGFGGGGAILVHAGSHLVLSNSQLFANKSAFGGAIVVSDSDLKLQNSVIRDNSASHSGGGLTAQGKGAFVEISNSSFKFNTAPKGGAICSTNGTLKMTTSSVYQNTATGENNTYGGGL